jgi:hypothetical protein
MNSTKSLKLFNAVIVPNDNHTSGEYKILTDYGVVVDPKATSQISQIEKYCKESLLSGTHLNKTFHKSWNKVISSTREELLLQQMLHYMTTYGTGHSSNFIYIPNEELNVPKVEINFLVIRGLSKEEMIEKCLNLLGSGAALKQETIVDVLSILKTCRYSFTGEEKIKNKEALMYICNETGVLPKDPVEVLRYLLFIATGKTLLIKSKETYADIEKSKDTYLISSLLAEIDVVEMSKIFNRFKPIFLSIKKIANKEAKAKINEISKLSKVHHIPMNYNILNNIGSCTLEDLKAQESNLMNANFFQLARCLNFLKRSQDVTHKAYNIRNGKSYVKEFESKDTLAKSKIYFLLSIILKKYNIAGRSFYIPNEVFYALPTSEKNFIGNIPMGTKFASEEPIASGVYWENSGGAYDIDISSLSIDGKVGWNSEHRSEVTYSGDMTDAKDGATEYIMSGENTKNPHLIVANIYRGNEKGSKMKIVFGKGSSVDRNYMMDPNKVWFSSDTESISKQSIVGLIYKEDKKYCAIALNLSTGNNRVSYNNEVSSLFIRALCQQYKNSFYLNELITECGGIIMDKPEDADVDLTPSKLEKDTIINIFKD